MLLFRNGTELSSRRREASKEKSDETETKTQKRKFPASREYKGII